MSFVDVITPDGGALDVVVERTAIDVVTTGAIALDVVTETRGPIDVIFDNTVLDIVVDGATYLDIIVAEGLPGPPGPPGPEGPPGVGIPADGEPGQVLIKQGTADYETAWATPATGSLSAYTHVQGVADDTWVIVHNLGFVPNWTVIDSGGTEVEGDPSAIDANTLTLNFSAAFSGRAYLS